MKLTRVALLAAFLSQAVSIATAHEVAVSEVINEALFEGVHSATSIGTGDVLRAPCTIRTGTESRLELILGDGSVARLGEKTVLELAKDKVSLQRGTMVLDDVKRGAGVSVAHGGAQFAIRGGTVFLSLGQESRGVLLIGAIAGKPELACGGKRSRLAPGELIGVSASGKQWKADFDLAQQVRTSALLNGFSSQLPGKAAIDREAKRFTELEARGFLKTPPSASELAFVSAIPVDVIGGLAQQNRQDPNANLPSRTVGVTRLPVITVPQPPEHTSVERLPPWGVSFGSVSSISITLGSGHEMYEVEARGIPPLPPLPEPEIEPTNPPVVEADFVMQPEDPPLRNFERSSISAAIKRR